MIRKSIVYPADRVFSAKTNVRTVNVCSSESFNYEAISSSMTRLIIDRRYYVQIFEFVKFSYEDIS